MYAEHLLPLFIGLCAILLPTGIRANTFIWDPSNQGSIDTWKRPYSSFSNPPICIPIPANMSLCHGMKYTEMRLPNLLHHDSLSEVIEQSQTWIQLTQLKCHPDSQLFLCSLFTPVCLDTTIPPCRSLCEAVQLGCEPYMRKHGYSWPIMMRCDQFPVDNNMCIQSQSVKLSAPKNEVSRGDSEFGARGEENKQANRTSSTQDDLFYQKLLTEICKANWVIKSGQISHNLRTHQVRIKKYKLIFGNLSIQAPINVYLNESSNEISEANANANFKKKQKFIIVGNSNGSMLSARLILNWNDRTIQIKKALKKTKAANFCLQARKSRLNQSGKPKRRQHRKRQPTQT